MCGILFHYSKHEIPSHEIDYNNLDIDKFLSNYLDEQTTNAGITSGSSNTTDTFDSLVPKILARGSDFAKYQRYNDHMELFSSVLSLRSPFTEQPIDDESYILQFNGELYNEEIDGDDHANDTAFIFQKLKESGSIIKTIGLLQGEFAYTILDRKNHKIYFGKDILGKKSLCYSIFNDELHISSCFPSTEVKQNFTECLNATVYTFDLTTFSLEVINFENNYYLPLDYTVSAITSITDDSEILATMGGSLQKAVQSRIKNIFPLHSSASNFGILFSGGLDCTLLACIAASLSNPGTKIDLLNVSFYNPRTQMNPSDTPDRKLSLKSWYNLYNMFIDRGVEFQLIEVDVPYEEYTKHRGRVIDLIYPNDTEMDLSIAIAFYFASRGVGQKVIFNSSVGKPSSFQRESYKSECKVLLSGLGADELFGGYTRHERIFTYVANDKKRELKGLSPKESNHDLSKLYKDLRDELQQDLSNLHVRNLSRDDKLISSWSKELRYPFLDTNFIYFVTRDVPLMSKMNYDDETGQITRKLLLRKLANALNMNWVADEPKRAIQFGAKSAKMESGTGKMKGTDRLTAGTCK